MISRILFFHNTIQKRTDPHAWLSCRAKIGGYFGFTLVELLVVVSIISILAAMLLPTLGNALSQARNMRCMGNLRQTALASHMYADANRGAFPNYFHETGYLLPYLGLTGDNLAHTSHPFYCPAAAGKPLVLWDSDPNNQYGGAFTSMGGWQCYAYNFQITCQADGTGWHTWGHAGTVPAMRVKSPSTTIWMVDSFSGRADSIYTYYLTPWVRHDNAMNSSFVDGHAEQIRQEIFEDWISRGAPKQSPYSWW